MEIRGGFVGGEMLLSTKWEVGVGAITDGEPKSIAAEIGIVTI